MKKKQLEIALFLSLILVATLFLYLQPAVIGMPANSYSTFLALFPGIVVVTISVIYIGRTRRYKRVASWVGLGMGLAYFFSLLNTQGLLVGVFAGLVLADLQIWSVVGCILAGAVTYSLEK